MSVKHPQFIMALDATHLSETLGLDAGFHEVNFDEFCKNAEAATILGQRNALEKDLRYRQYLPAPVILTHDNKVVAFRRTEKVGEETLVGKVGVIWGGHVDFSSVKLYDVPADAINVAATVARSTMRELEEEVTAIITMQDGERLQTEERITFRAARHFEHVKMEEQGYLLIANDVPVDRHHFALVTFWRAAEGMKFQSNEAELEDLPLMTARELLDAGYPLETWARVVLEHLVKQDDAKIAAAANEVASSTEGIVFGSAVSQNAPAFAHFDGVDLIERNTFLKIALAEVVAKSGREKSIVSAGPDRFSVDFQSPVDGENVTALMVEKDGTILAGAWFSIGFTEADQESFFAAWKKVYYPGA